MSIDFLNILNTHFAYSTISTLEARNNSLFFFQVTGVLDLMFLCPKSLVLTVSNVSFSGGFLFLFCFVFFPSITKQAINCSWSKAQVSPQDVNGSSLGDTPGTLTVCCLCLACQSITVCCWHRGSGDTAHPPSLWKTRAEPGFKLSYSQDAVAWICSLHLCPCSGSCYNILEV